MASELPTVQIYTDGGADPNPGEGGWGAVLISGLHTKELSGAASNTTNNRMEIQAAVSALSVLRQACAVTIFTDSQYLRKGMTEWIDAWVANGWQRSNGRPVENADLWQDLLDQVERHHVEWEWVRGHRGNPLNERADQLATQARLKRGPVGSTGSAAPKPRLSDRQDPLPEVVIYTRGAALGQPGPAGYAALVLREQQEERIVSGSWPSATNNIMELWAAIAGLQSLEHSSRVTIYTTSKYLLDGATRWLAQWERKQWRTQSGQPVKNRELWAELVTVMGDHDLSWEFLPRTRRDDYCQRASQAAREQAESRQADNER